MTNRRAIYVNCDGLGASWIAPERTPALAALKERSVWAADHHAIFPSVTRCSAACVTTGCHPARHGLHGNRMALIESGRFVVRDVGKPDFRDHMRRATGRTLWVPGLAERTASTGGMIAFSNVSPGAAYFLDPDHHGCVYHRAGSFGPGGRQISDNDHLDISHDIAGDIAMTKRFCTEVIENGSPAAAILWLANPDLTLHGAPLGSPDHIAAMRAADACVARVAEAVARRRRAGDDILLMIGSDHGQETIHAGVDVTGWLAAHGCAQAIGEGRMAIASQGTSALVYALDDAAALIDRLMAPLQNEAWVGQLIHATELGSVGHRAAQGLVAAIDMGRVPNANAFGVAGARFVATDGEKPVQPGCGQHGGLGEHETRPFLAVDHPTLAPTTLTERTSLIDLAPTILAFLGLSATGMDGRALAQGVRAPGLNQPVL